ncbi:MAG: asparagine synthase-related protein [Bacillota bacterium]
MSGLIAVFGESESSEDLDPLIEKVKFRGKRCDCEIDEENCSMTFLSGNQKEEDNGLPLAVDGYLMFPGEEGKTIQGTEGLEHFCKIMKKEGLSCFDNIEGEFALAFSDGNRSCLVARDPLGIKPLYYARKDDTLYIASEIKALIDLDSKIKEVPPGCYYDRKKGWVKYYHLPPLEGKNRLSLAEAEEKMRHLLALAVEERISGVEGLGVYLSGGLDSSVVAALAAEISEEPISTYTVGVQGSRDIEYAAMVADRIGSDQHFYTYGLDEMLEVLPDVIYHLESFDSAYVRSSIPNYIAAREAAADGRRVMLTGEGSDEMFAGYSYLKSLDSEEEITSEIEGFFRELSRTGLQRVDRMNAAHGLECRIPFLKLALLELVREFPLDWKLHEEKEEPVDKWILRRAFEKEIGTKVAWREKQQFDQGSGSAGMLEAVAEEEISDSEYAAEAEAAPVPVRNKEELYYFRIFRQFYPESVLPLVGRWKRTG